MGPTDIVAEAIRQERFLPDSSSKDETFNLYGYLQLPHKQSLSVIMGYTPQPTFAYKRMTEIGYEKGIGSGYQLGLGWRTSWYGEDTVHRAYLLIGRYFPIWHPSVTIFTGNDDRRSARIRSEWIWRNLTPEISMTSGVGDANRSYLTGTTSEHYVIYEGKLSYEFILKKSLFTVAERWMENSFQQTMIGAGVLCRF